MYNCGRETTTDRLCEFSENLVFSALPDAVVEQTKKYIADYYSASIAGYWINRKFNQAVVELVRETGGTEESNILFEKEMYPATYAAYMNAIYAHGADMDDGNRKAAGHIGASVISAVFAMADKSLCDWKDVIVSINVGYEFFNRVVGVGQPGLYNKGFHSTGVGGAIAAAAACAKLLKLDFWQIYNSVSLAAIQSGGLIIIDESGQCCKPINPANAARIGIESALLASKGVESSRNPLESRKGWFNAFCGEVDEKSILDGLGNRFTINDSYLKLYPTCRHTHSCIDAILEINEKIKKNYDSCEEHMEPAYQKIIKIEIYIYPSAIRSAGNIDHPANADEAKFSIKYAVATACVRGTFALADLETVGKNKSVNELVDRIRLIASEEMENRQSNIRGSRVVAYLRDGNIIDSYVPIPKGEGKAELQWTDLILKMVACANHIFEPCMAEHIVEMCKDIDMSREYSSITKRITELTETSGRMHMDYKMGLL